MRKLSIALGLLAVIVAIALLARGRLDTGESASRQPDQRAAAPRTDVPLPPGGGVVLGAGDGAADSLTIEPLPGDDTTAPPARPAPDRTAPGSDRPAGEPAARGVPSGQPPAEAGRPAGSGDEAERVLARAARAYAALETLRADFVQRVENPILGRTTISRGHLAQRPPGRFLMRFSEPAGDLVVSDGSSLWVYYPSVDPGQVMRLPASAGAGSMDLQAQFLGDPRERFHASLRGQERIDGRAADVLVLDPRQAAGFRRLVVWVDRADGLARRFEIVEENGTVRRFDLSDMRTGVTLEDALFRFTPPEGARVVERG